MTLVRTCCGLISFQIAAAKNFAWESHWAKWKQSWDFCTFQVHKIEVLRHLRTLPTVTPMSVRDVCRWSVDLVIWLNVINVTEHSSLPSLPNPFAKWLLSSPRCRGDSPWIFTLGSSHAALWTVMPSTHQFNQQVESTPFCPSRVAEGWCHAARSQIGRCCQFLLFQKRDSWPRSGHTWMRMTLVHTCYLDWFYLRKQLQKSLLANRNESSGRCGSSVETSARSVFTKSRLCGTCAHC